jgi:hypothetical protein
MAPVTGVYSLKGKPEPVGCVFQPAKAYLRLPVLGLVGSVGSVAVVVAGDVTVLLDVAGLPPFPSNVTVWV